VSNNTTVHMLRVYEKVAQVQLFLSGMFQTPPENYYDSEEVEIDIIRSEENVAIVVQDIAAGHRMNTLDLSTNKRFKPPVFKEGIPLNSHDLMNRTPGENPFKNPVFRANLISRIFSGMGAVERKLRRSIELQASQVLQTGVVTLADENGVALYTLDFKPKSSHFPTAGTAWSAGGATIETDIEALCELIRSDGLGNPDQLILGSAAFRAITNDTSLKSKFDNKGLYNGQISPMTMNGQGGTFRGILEVGNYKLDLWTYGARYTHPQSGNSTQFLAPANCIVRDSTARLDATFGSIPNIGQMLGAQANQYLPELPTRISANGIDLFTNAWLTPNGESLVSGVGMRPLLIPTAIDTYGCINTQAV